MSRLSNKATLDLNEAIAGFGVGLLTLIAWYEVVPVLGINAGSAAAFYVPYLGFQLHHEVYGITLIVIGAALTAWRPGLAVLGFFLIGLGAAIFVDDLFRHCLAGGIPVSCRAWP